MNTTQPEALLIAEECQRRSEDSRYERNLFRRAAAELRRLHAYAAELESQVIADCMAGGAGGVSPLMGAAGDAGWLGLTDEDRDRAVGDLIDYGTGFVAPLYSVIEGLEKILQERNSAPSSAKGVAL